VSKRKLLLADDSITIQKVVNLTFADEGIEVIAVGDGDSAMRKFDEFMPDLVMADVNMPGLNGYEVCRIIKQTEETKKIPVILLVGSFEPFDETEAKAVGAEDFLTKPFQSIRQLVNKVTELLNRPYEETVESPAETPVDSFADTLEFDKREETPSEFGDAGMDDEMIETSPANDYLDDSNTGYQRETTIDYAKTQPLNAEDLKGFNIVANGEAQIRSAYQSEESTAQEETAAEETITENSEPPSFDEEARKMGFSTSGEDSYDRNDYSFHETDDLSEYGSSDESNEEESEPAQFDNLSETEPQIDYALPVEEIREEQEITDAETLEPEVSYETESPREAVFSQASEETETEVIDEESDDAKESMTEALEEETDETSVNEESTTAIPEGEEPETEAPADENVTSESTASEALSAVESESDEVSDDFSAPEAVEEEVSEIEEETTEETFGETSEEEISASEETASTGETEAEEFSPQPETSSEPEMIDETPIPASAVSSAEVPPLDFTDDDLLDLPPLVEETGIRPQPLASPVVPEVVAPQMQTTEPESRITVTKTVAESEIALHFPPELIEAIAQKVADKISQKTLSEVLPQITELVVQKLAEQESKK